MLQNLVKDFVILEATQHARVYRLELTNTVFKEARMVRRIVPVRVRMLWHPVQQRRVPKLIVLWIHCGGMTGCGLAHHDDVRRIGLSIEYIGK